jgi:hypothetical protein
VDGGDEASPAAVQHQVMVYRPATQPIRVRENVRETPNSHRRLTHAFDIAPIKLRFAISPDMEVQKLVISYDLDILAIPMKFGLHIRLGSRCT